MDPKSSAAFYRSLFGWTFITRGPQGAREYYVAQLRGRDVAGIGPLLDGLPGSHPAWITYIAVADVDTTTRVAISSGGYVVVEGVQLRPAGRMAVLLDPTGAIFAIWEPEVHQGAQRVNEAGAWALNTLYSPDLATSARFYGGVFGWKTEVVGESSLSIFRLDEYFGGVPRQPVPRDVVAVMLPLSDRGATPYWEVDFWVDDVDAAAARAATHGGGVILPPRDSGIFRYALLADPEGAAFTVSKMTTNRADRS